jgi:hypothetical protein
MFVAINYSPRTTAWMQEVEQRKEQLPRHEEHEVLIAIFLRVLRAFVVNFLTIFDHSCPDY